MLEYMVTPHAGVWIEIVHPVEFAKAVVVTPHAGVWIEIIVTMPSEEDKPPVTPHAGVWIEIHQYQPGCTAVRVTPHAGVWIEIAVVTVPSAWYLSPPTRGCGLKCSRPTGRHGGEVTPHAGVWIEMEVEYALPISIRCHPPRGGVD